MELDIDSENFLRLPDCLLITRVLGQLVADLCAEIPVHLIQFDHYIQRLILLLPPARNRLEIIRERSSDSERRSESNLATLLLESQYLVHS